MMANEPNNAEERLKEYAAERRQQAPKEIHAATRNLLQGEVRRVYGGPQEERRARVRLRWMQAFAALAIAAAIPLFLLPRNLKNAREAEPSKPGEVTLPTEKKRGEAPIVLSDTKEPVAPVVVVAEPPAAAAPQSARALAVAPTAGVGPEAEQRKAVAKDEIASASATVTARAAVASAVNSFSLANNVSNQPILSRFQFEQSGARVKITEADGSVYPGRVISQQNGNDVFYAAGVSRSLKQGVTVTGQVVRTSLASAQQQPPQQQRARNERDSQLLLNSVSNYRPEVNADDVRVQGQATVGNSQYKVDAQLAPGP